MDLNSEVSPQCLLTFSTFPSDNPDFWHQLVSLYKVGKEVYLNGTRGTDPKPFKIHKELGDGQYEISRDGKVELAEDGKTARVVLEENLQLEP